MSASIYDGRSRAMAQELGITMRAFYGLKLHLKPDMPLECMRLIVNRKDGSGKSAELKRRYGAINQAIVAKKKLSRSTTEDEWQLHHQQT